MDALKVFERHFTYQNDALHRLKRDEKRALAAELKRHMTQSPAVLAFAGDPLEVIDFAALDSNSARNRARIVEMDAPPHVATASFAPGARFFRIADIDGFVFIRNCLTPQQQFDWALRCVRDFSTMPYNNLSNLHGAQPDHWMGALESGALDTFRTLRWSNIGFNYNWTRREYVEFGRVDEARPNSVDAAAAGARTVGGGDGVDAASHAAHILRLESHFPQDLGALAAQLAHTCGYEMQVESGICNFYSTASAHMGAHVDDAEHDLSKPVVGLSLGCTGVFLMGGATRDQVPTAFYLRSGDAIVQGGASRMYYHGVPRIVCGELPTFLSDITATSSLFVHSHLRRRPGVHELDATERCEVSLLLEYLKTCRLNLNMRQVRDLEALRAKAQAVLEHNAVAAAPCTSTCFSLFEARLHGIVLECVLAFLPLSELLCSVALVSTSLHAITRQPSTSLYASIDLRPLAARITDTVLSRWLVPVVAHSRQLSLEDCCEITSDALKAVLSAAGVLETLVLTDVGAAACDDAVFSLAESTSLRALTMGYCDNVSDRALEAVVVRGGRGCRLHTLVLRGCRHLNLAWLASSSPPSSLLQPIPSLRHVELSHVRGIEPDTFVALAQRLPCVETLNLWDCSGTSNAVLAALAAHCHALTDLNIGGAAAVDSDGVRALMRSPVARSLRAITLYGVYAIEEASALLEILVASAAANASPPWSASRTATLLSALERAHSRAEVRALCAPLRDCSPMHIFNIDKLVRVADDRLLIVAAVLCGASLRQLHISNCKWVSEAALLSTLHDFRALERIDAWGCVRACSDSSIDALARAFGVRLREIHLGNSLKLSDAALFSLATHCPLLRGVGLSCTAATIAGVVALLHAPCAAHLVEHRVRIHLAGDENAPLEWPPSADDIARCASLLDNEATRAELAEQAQTDEDEEARIAPAVFVE